MYFWLDITGQQFGRLLAIRKVSKTKQGGWMWLCLCNCGKEVIVASCNLKNGATKSCGCLNKERLPTYYADKILRDDEEYFLRKAHRVGINRYG